MNKKQIDSLLACVVSIAGRDFSQKAVITGEDEMLDALASGINMLSEEIQASTVAREYFDGLFQAMPNVLIVCDLNGLVQSVNNTIEKYSFYKDELIGQHISVFGEELIGFFADEGANNCELNIPSGTGEKVPMYASKSVLTQGSSQEILIILHDLSVLKAAEDAKKAAEEQLLQAQKMESIGRLAGGIAHDFNNLLGGVLGYIGLLKKDKSIQKILNDNLSKYIDIIESSTLRASELTKQLLGFARKGNYEMKVQAPGPIIKEARDILYRTIPSTITVKAYFPKDLWMVEIDATQLMQVLMNLGLNSRDAMPQGGEILIDAINLTPDETYCHSHKNLKPQHDYVKISVHDTGEGIAKENMSKIFEPFFTTKDTGKGTGLGLAMVYGIIQAHDGDVYAYSEEGRGSSFSIYLPAVKDVTSVEQDLVTPEIPKAINKTALIVDDESIMCELAEDILSQYGCKVLTAENGEIGVKVFQEQQTAIDFILLDVIMPIMDGYAVFHEIRKIKPEVPIIFCSGYSQSDKIIELKKQGKVGFIKKPFKLNDLLVVIQKTMH